MKILRPIRSIAVTGFAVAGLVAAYVTVPAAAVPNGYGMGTYGACSYGDCGITVNSTGTVSVSVTPSGSTTCTVKDDDVSVLTDSSTGYNLSVSDNDTSNTMSGSNGGSVTAVSGSMAAPTALSANKWGYRVDSVGGFGAGPTSAVTNGSVPSGNFAPVPLSSGTADTVVNSSSPANPAVHTTVWYGLCASNSLVAGTFSDGIVYTAVIN